MGRSRWSGVASGSMRVARSAPTPWYFEGTM
jgi:hypothetical protein